MLPPLGGLQNLSIIVPFLLAKINRFRVISPKMTITGEASGCYLGVYPFFNDSTLRATVDSVRDLIILGAIIYKVISSYEKNSYSHSHVC